MEFLSNFVLESWYNMTQKPPYSNCSGPDIAEFELMTTGSTQLEQRKMNKLLEKDD